MTWQPLKSSNLAACDYANGDLLVRFKGGGEYRYRGVPEEVYQGLLTAESPGRYLQSEVISTYDVQKVEKDR